MGKTDTDNAKPTKGGGTDSKQFEDGPVTNRSLTDFIFCVLMLLFWALCGYIISHAFKNGDPIRLTQIYDIDGIPCGSKEHGTQDYKKAYFHQPLTAFGKAVCVKACPVWNAGDQRITKLECFSEGPLKSGFNDCEYTGDFDFVKLPDGFIDFAKEDFLIYNT